MLINNKEYSVKDIDKLEEEYTPTLANNYAKASKITKIFKEDLKVGQGYNLEDSVARAELDRLFFFINTDGFIKEYGRRYNIVDLYLTTNLQISDLCSDYLKHLKKEEIPQVLKFIRSNLNRVDNNKIFQERYKQGSKRIYQCRFYRPSKKSLNDLLNLDFRYYNALDATYYDVKMAHEALLELNEKYGVKYDDISLYLLLDEFLKKNIESFYKIGEENKARLDEYTHVVKREIPLLTRREKNL